MRCFDPVKMQRDLTLASKIEWVQRNDVTWIRFDVNGAWFPWYTRFLWSLLELYHSDFTAPCECWFSQASYLSSQAQFLPVPTTPDMALHMLYWSMWRVCKQPWPPDHQLHFHYLSCSSGQGWAKASIIGCFGLAWIFFSGQSRSFGAKLALNITRWYIQ